MADGKPVESFNYLEDLLSRLCVQALQSEQIGEWVLLLEVLDRIGPLGDEFIKSQKVRHYIKRVFQYCVNTKSLQSNDVIAALRRTFPKSDFDELVLEPVTASSSEVSVNINDAKDAETKKEASKIVISKEPYLVENFKDIFKILPGDLEERVYEAPQLSVVDLQKYLPYVVAEVTKLESTWNNCMGMTISSLNTNLPQVIYRPSPPPSPVGSQISRKKCFLKNARKDISFKPKTGREVVEHLLRTNRSAKAEIWYLNFVNNRRYDPYDLKVASKSTVKNDHIVISVFGVLHIRPDGTSYLTSLFQWYMESTYFNVIKNINFFKDYFVIKAFKRWKTNHKYKKFAIIFNKIKENILFDVPSFPKTILKISSLLYQFNSVKLLPDFRSGQVHIKSVNFLMNEQLDIGDKYFSRFFIYTQDIINKCRSSAIDYKNYCKAQLNAYQSTNSKESMSSARKRKEVQRFNLTCANRNLKRLDNFVNLVNQLTFSHLVYIFCQNLHDFIHQHILENEFGCFYTFVDISPESTLILSPSGDAIFNTLSKSLKEILMSIAGERLKKINLNEERNESLAEKPSEELDQKHVGGDEAGIASTPGTPVSDNVEEEQPTYDYAAFIDIVLDNTLVESSLKKLHEELSFASNESNNRVRAYSWIYEIIEFITTWNTEKMKEWKQSLPSALEKRILQMKSWLKQIDTIVTSFVSSNGVLFIDSSTIASTLLPQLTQMLEKMITELTTENYNDIISLAHDLSEKIKTSSSFPSGIEAFAVYFVSVNELAEEVEPLKKRVHHLRGVLDVVKHCCRQLTKKEVENEEKIVKLWEEFMFSLQKAQGYVSQHSPALVKQMNDEIEDMRNKLLNIVVEATSGIFIAPDQEPSFVLVEMQKLCKTFESILQKLKLYGECKAKMTGETIDLSDADTSQKTINARFEVWRYLELSWQTIKEWKHTFFAKLNVKKVYTKVQDWLIAADSLQRDVPPHDGVMKRWVKLVKDFSNIINVMKELSNPALKTRHWKEIFVALGHVYEERPYRVSEIMAMPLLDNVYKISQICLAASSEHALCNCLNSLIRHWEKRNFKFAKKFTDIDLNNNDEGNSPNDGEEARLSPVGYILTGIDELACELEDNLVTLQSMLGSPHVAEVRELAGSWNAKLQEVQEILDLWMVTQQEWLYLCNMFSKVSMQKRHPVEFRIFIDTNQLFKELIDSIMVDSVVLNILNKRTESKWSGPNDGFLKQILLQVTQKQSVVIKQMEEYLSKIQSTFPRLYYLGNDEMLNLLAITRNPPAIVPFVKKCFPAIVDIRFGMPQTENALSSLDVTLNVHRLLAMGFIGHYDEGLSFRESLPFNTTIEKWLKMIETKMKEAVWIDYGECQLEIHDRYTSRLFDPENLRMLSDQFSFQSIVLHVDITQSKICSDAVLRRRAFDEIQVQQNRAISLLSEFLQDTSRLANGLPSERKFLVLIKVLLMKLLYYKEKITMLKSCQQLSKSSFEWLKLVKFCNLADDGVNMASKEDGPNIAVECMNETFHFGYEYYGPAKSIVYTPLSDRCFLSLFLAFRDNRVGCFTGIEQSGKSETSYELAKLLGRHFMSLHCTSLTLISVLKTFLHGALATGSVLCLENVHLLECNMLSVLGQVLNDLSYALNCITTNKQQMSDVATRKCMSEYKEPPSAAAAPAFGSTSPTPPHLHLFNTRGDQYKDTPYLSRPRGNISYSGQFVDVSRLFACVVTSNKSFNCWKSIPDNLRESLRPVAFTNLDDTNIFKVWFLSSGFKMYNVLAEKLAFLMGNHRNKGCFSLQKLHHIIHHVGITVQLRKYPSEEREIHEFATSLINMIKPALPHFQFVNLAKEISNIFTGSKVDGAPGKGIIDTLLLESVREQINADNLSPKSEFINKVLELHQVLSSNQSVILVGGVASGKTTCYKTLARSLCQFYSPWSQRVAILTDQDDSSFARVNMNVFYPNVLQADQLYGYFDAKKNSQVDGLLTKILSNIAFLEHVTSKKQNESNDGGGAPDASLNQIQQWFVMDGHPDDSWVAPFYSLLDCTNQFVLGSGKRIHLLDNMKVLFETEHMETISPSLISRCAILHFQNGEVVTWRSVFYSWSTAAYNKYSITQESLRCVELVLEHALESTVHYIHSECESLFNETPVRDMKRSRSAAVVECHYVLQVLSALLQCWKSRDMATVHETGKSTLEQFMCHALAYSIVNGLSAFIHESSIKDLDLFVRESFSTCAIHPVILNTPISDCFFDGKTGSLVVWNEVKFSSQISLTASNMVVTKDIQQYYYLTDLLLSSKSNVLMVGDPGAGKASLVKYLLSSKHQIMKLQLSKAMNAEHFQDIMREKSVAWLKRQSQRGKLKSARQLSKENMIIFLADVNLAVSNNHSTGQQPVMESIRQMICEGGVYDVEGKYFHHLPPVQLVASYTPPEMDFVGNSCGNTYMNGRIRRHFSMVHIKTDTEREWTAFFSKHDFWLEGLNWATMKTTFSQLLASTTVRIHQAVHQRISSRDNPLYVFSKNDIAKVYKTLTFLSTNGNRKLGLTYNVGDVNKNGADSEDIKEDGDTKEGQMKHLEMSVSDYVGLNHTFEERKDFITNKLTEVIVWWCHVIKQIYRDRYVCEEDSKFFMEYFKDEVKLLCSYMCKFVGELLNSSSDEEEERLKTELSINPTNLQLNILVSFPSKEHYGKFVRLEEFRSIVYSKLQQYDGEYNDIREVKLLMFEEMVFHVERICKVTNIPGGHCLIVTQDGFGRTEMVELTAKLMSAQLFTLSTSSEPCDNRMVIKDACNMAGLKSKPVMLYATEGVSEETLTLLSALVCDGLCPGLYTPKELPLICNQLLPASHRMRTNGYGQIEDRFFQRIKQNLHVLICIKDDERLSTILNKYPILIHKVACIDVYKEWSRDFLFRFARSALQDDGSTATTFLDHVVPSGMDINAFISKISTVMAQIHVTSRCFLKESSNEKSLYTPQKFDEFVQLFINLCRERVQKIQGEFQEVEKANKKIQEVKDVIVNIEQKIETLSPILSEAKLSVSEANEERTSTQNNYLNMRQECEQQIVTIEKLKVPFNQLKEETENEFEKISPEYLSAVKSIEELTQDVIDELRSYYNPPQGVIIVCGMLCAMFHLPDDWETAKLLLMRDKFFEELCAYRKDAIPKDVFRKLTKFVNNPIAHPDQVKEYSIAAYNLAVWLFAIHSYGCILKELAPKKNALSKANENVFQAERALVAKKGECTRMKDSLEKKILDYKDKLKKARLLEREDQVLRTSLKKTQDLLKTSEVFISEWSVKTLQGKANLHSAPGDCILTSASIVYNSYFLSDKQQQLLSAWKQDAILQDGGGSLLFSERDFSIMNILGCEKERNNWLKANRDLSRASLEHALKIRALTNLGSRCWSFLIDSHGFSRTLVSLIENKEKVIDYSEMVCKSTNKSRSFSQNDNDGDENTLVIMDADMFGLQRIMEKYMLLGSAILLQHVERLDDATSFSTLLGIRISGGQFKSSIDGEVKKCHPKFRLYLSANTPLVSLSEKRFQEVMDHTIAFNLDIDSEALHEKLLMLIISAERPELIVNYEREKADLLFLEQEDKEVHSTIFDKVKGIETNLADDAEIANFVGFHQEQLMLLEEKIFDCKRNIDSISKELSDYVPLATYLTSLYFIVKKVQTLHPLYHFSLRDFTNLLSDTLMESALSDVAMFNTKARNQETRNLFTRNLHERLSISLFKEHVILLPLHIVLERMRIAYNLKEEEVVLFTHGFTQQHIDGNVTHGDTQKPDWLKDVAWRRFKELSDTIPCFFDLLQKVHTDSLLWEEYFQLGAMATSPPDIATDLINEFLTGLLWLAYDESTMPDVCSSFITCQLGPEFTMVPPFDHMHACAVSTNQHVFTTFLLPDNDEPLMIEPIQVVTRLASKQKRVPTISAVSMNSDEELEQAINVAQAASKKGDWVLLENCHLVKEWKKCFINSLENIHREAKQQRTRKDQVEDEDQSRHFHLWFVTRSPGDAHLATYIIENSFPIVWQFSKNDLSEMDGIFTHLKPDESTRDEMLNEKVKAARNVFQQEVLKNYNGAYSEQYKVGVKDLLFSSSLCHVIKPHVLHDVIKEVVYLPRLYDEYDRDLLGKEYQGRKVGNAADYLLNTNSSTRIDIDTSSNKASLLKPTTSSPASFNIEWVSTYVTKFSHLYSLTKSTKYGASERNLVTECANDDVRLIQKNLKTILYHLSLLDKVFAQKICRTRVIAEVYGDLCEKRYPACWKVDWIASLVACDRSRDFDAHFEMLGTIIEYHNALFSATGEIWIPLDLRRFRHPKRMVNALKLLRAVEGGSNAEMDAWIAMICPEEAYVDHVPCPEDGVFLHNIKLCNAALDADNEDLPLVPASSQCETRVPLLHFKPRLLEDEIEMILLQQIPVYSMDRKDVLFHAAVKMDAHPAQRDVHMVV